MRCALQYATMMQILLTKCESAQSCALRAGIRIIGVHGRHGHKQCRWPRCTPQGHPSQLRRRLNGPVCGMSHAGFAPQARPLMSPRFLDFNGICDAPNARKWTILICNRHHRHRCRCPMGMRPGGFWRLAGRGHAHAHRSPHPRGVAVVCAAAEPWRPLPLFLRACAARCWKFLVFVSFLITVYVPSFDKRCGTFLYTLMAIMLGLFLRLFFQITPALSVACTDSDSKKRDIHSANMT